MSNRTVSGWLVPPLVAVLWAGSATAQTGTAGTATVTGTVVDSAAGTPLANAEVYVAAADPTARRGARTGANGRYTITGVAAGTQTVRVRILGFGAAERQVTLR